VKNLATAVLMVISINFLALAGGAGWLFQSGHLNRDRVKAIREVMFPPATQPTTQPSEEVAAVAPSSQTRLDELLARHIGSRSAAEQADYLQRTFDAQMGQLDQRQRQLEDLQRLVSAAQTQLQTDKTKLTADQQKLADNKDQAAKLAADQGFQDSLSLYNSMPAKQVKAVFLAMDDDAVVNYLRAMEPKSAAKILKEFKSPEETERVHKLMDRMREPVPVPTTQPTQPATGSP
jgi:flagellar motility protein MotE (MotC chaperone)